MSTPGALLVVDELGPLELVQGLGWAPLLPCCALTTAPSSSSCGRRSSRRSPPAMGDRAVTRIDVTPDTRDDAFERALAALGLASMIALHDVSVSFDDVQALAGVSLTIPRGDVVLFGGASGSGKSTLLRLVAGIVPQLVPASVTGDAWIEGRRTVDMPRADLAAAVGLVFQNPASQLFNLTVREEVAFGPHNFGLPAREVETRTAWALEVTGLADKGGRDVRALSGGERQRVALAAVLAMRPAVLALDEPMASLDVAGTRLVVDVLQQLNRTEGTTVLVAEHRLREAALVARRTVLMDEGRIVADGATADVLGERAMLRQLGLRRPALTPQTDWESLIVPGSPSAGRAVVRLDGVEASYGARGRAARRDHRDSGRRVPRARRRQRVGQEHRGAVARRHAESRRGADAAGPTACPIPGRGVGVLLQEPREQLFCETVEEEVAFGPMNLGRDPSAPLARFMAAADLEAVRTRPVHTLSHGQLHRTAFAATLAAEPRLLILDEPTVGQDWRHLEQLMDVVDTMRRAGAAVLLISHDFKLIHRHATRVVLLRNGRVAADGVPVDAPPEQDAP